MSLARSSRVEKARAAVLAACAAIALVLGMTPCVWQRPITQLFPLAFLALFEAPARGPRGAYWIALVVALVAGAMAPLHEIEVPLWIFLAIYAFASLRLVLFHRAWAGAIAGLTLLYAISIPNVLCFTCKSKQSEAKTNLSGLFTAEKAFHGEYGFFTTDLSFANWAPDGSPLYVYGFAIPSEKVSTLEGHDPTRSDTADPRVRLDRYSSSKMRDLAGRPFTGRDLPVNATATRDTFLAVAVGDIDSSDGYDIWAIDEKRRLHNLSNDCTD